MKLQVKSDQDGWRSISPWTCARIGRSCVKFRFRNRHSISILNVWVFTRMFTNAYFQLYICFYPWFVDSLEYDTVVHDDDVFKMTLTTKKTGLEKTAWLPNPSTKSRSRLDSPPHDDHLPDNNGQRLRPESGGLLKHTERDDLGVKVPLGRAGQKMHRCARASGDRHRWICCCWYIPNFLDLLASGETRSLSIESCCINIQHHVGLIQVWPYPHLEASPNSTEKLQKMMKGNNSRWSWPKYEFSNCTYSEKCGAELNLHLE